MVQLVNPAGDFFVLDLLGKGARDPLVQWLRPLMQDESVKKVVHDCRMLSDAFLHRMNIVLTNVHDTLAWHMDQSAWRVWEPLDLVLEHNGLPRTLEQTGTQHCAYWARRPITAAMLSVSLDGLENIISLSVLQCAGTDSEGAESTAR